MLSIALNSAASLKEIWHLKVIEYRVLWSSVKFQNQNCFALKDRKFPVKRFPLIKHDVRGSVHHSTIHKEKSSKMKQFIKIYYSIFIWSSTCFGLHTAHHQEPKTALAASGFAYVKGCWTLRLLDAVSVQQPQRPTTFQRLLVQF
jgi:hypothetical protein